MKKNKNRLLPNPWDRNCPSRTLLSLIADKWTLLLFPHLAAGAKRNAELMRLLDGISQKVLTETLRGLEAHGLVARKDYGTVPPKVDYQLTALGETLAQTMDLLDQWVVDHYYDVEAAKEQFQRRRKRAHLAV
jgi:DNA-binding HxlR family transcriptional regulator